MKKLIFLPLICMCLISCGSVLINKNHKAIYDFESEQFDVYSFRLCEKLKTNGNKRFVECDSNCENNDIHSNPELQVVEELYFLVSSNTNLALYFTTFSHKYIRLNDGVYNDSTYLTTLYTADIETVYTGKFLNDSITFTNNKERLTFHIKYVKDCSLKIESIEIELLSGKRDNSLPDKTPINISDNLSVNMNFVKTNRILKLGKLGNSNASLEAIKMTTKGNRVYFYDKEKKVSEYKINLKYFASD